MSWRQNIVDALAPERQIVVHDERRFAAKGFVYRPAAVLIALTDRSEPGVILTQRPDWLRSHAGQVAFPGGKIDDSDNDVFAAALREAEEEIALPRDAVTLLGEADTYHSGSGYRISPVLGIIPPDLPLVANPEEVEDWFEVPLDFLVDPKNAKLQTTTWPGQQRQYSDMDWQGRRIWGVTAGIIANLARRLRG
jgi:8-oxo-dGTP pyrophosphatase MutT (NUDIX family)